MRQIYQETFDEIKQDKEKDENEAKRLFERYNYLNDPDYMMDNKESPKHFDLGESEQGSDADLFSTELSDPEFDYLYKRYKLLRTQN